MYPRFYGLCVSFSLDSFTGEQYLRNDERRQPVSVVSGTEKRMFETLIARLVMTSHAICVNIIPLASSVSPKVIANLTHVCS